MDDFVGVVELPRRADRSTLATVNLDTGRGRFVIGGVLFHHRFKHLLHLRIMVVVFRQSINHIMEFRGNLLRGPSDRIGEAARIQESVRDICVELGEVRLLNGYHAFARWNCGRRAILSPTHLKFLLAK